LQKIIKGKKEMALRIASVPVLKGKTADRFDDLMAISESKRSEKDFTRQIAVARQILSKAKL
jgi:hypothetical protein